MKWVGWSRPDLDAATPEDVDEIWKLMLEEADALERARG